MSGPRAVPYLLRLHQLPQDKVDAADVKADFGRGVLDGREGIQSSTPLLPVRCTHPFLPQPDRLHQGHGLVGCGIPLCRVSRPSPCPSWWCSSASLPPFCLYFCLAPAPVTNLAGNGLTRIISPGMGKCSTGCL